MFWYDENGFYLVGLSSVNTSTVHESVAIKIVNFLNVRTTVAARKTCKDAGDGLVSTIIPSYSWRETRLRRVVVCGSGETRNIRNTRSTRRRRFFFLCVFIYLTRTSRRPIKNEFFFNSITIIAQL